MCKGKIFFIITQTFAWKNDNYGVFRARLFTILHELTLRFGVIWKVI